MSELVLGMDIGTSTCQVALYEDSGQPKPPLAINADGLSTYMPSSAFHDPGGGLLVAEEADAATRSGRPGVRLPSAKRYATADGSGLGALPPWPACAPKPQEVVRRLVREVLDRARIRLEALGKCSSDKFGEVPLHLSCPTNAGLDWRNLLIRASRDAGMRRIPSASVIEEATCAALGHAAMMGLTQGEYLVYDYGGGTFDAAWLQYVSRERTGPALSVIASEGHALGGDDTDRKLYDLLLERASVALGASAIETREFLEQDEPVAGRRLWEEARKLKHDLSREQAASLSLDAVLQGHSDDGVGSSGRLVVTREDLNCLLSDDVSTTLNTVVGLLIRQVDCRLGRPDGESRTRLRGVLLSGGMCTIPYVEQRIRRYFPNIDVERPRVATLQDCVAIGCSRPLELELSNRKHCSWSVSLILSSGNEVALFEPYEEVFDWLVAYGRQPHVAKKRLPAGARPKSVVFRNLRSDTIVTVPVSLPGCTSRPSWEDDIEASFGHLGLELVRGSRRAWVTELPWFSDAERLECGQRWEQRRAREADARARQVHEAIVRGRGPDQDPG